MLRINRGNATDEALAETEEGVSLFVFSCEEGGL